MLLCVTLAHAGEIDGTIYEAGQEIGGVLVTLANQTATTDVEGRFVLEDVPPGNHLLRIAHPDGKRVEQVPITVLSDACTPFTFDFSAAALVLDEVIVPGSRQPPTPSKQTILGSEIQRVTGAAHDVLHSLQILPGVTSPAELNAVLCIRGGGPFDNAYYFDRIYLSSPYHFLGVLTTVSSEIIESVDVHAGGFGAEFGANAQAVIDIHARQAKRERFSLTSNVSLLMSELFMESPLGSKGSFYLAGRRSYADLIVPEIEGISKFPRFWDYQAGFDYAPTPNQHLRFSAFASNDSLELIWEEDVMDEPDLVGKVRYTTEFAAQGLTLRSQLGEHGTLQSTLSHRQYLIDVSYGKGYFLLVEPDFYTLREDAEYAIHPRHTLQLGGVLETNFFKISSFFPRPPNEEGETSEDFEEQPKVKSDIEKRLNYAEGYLQDRFALMTWLSLTLGVRLNYFNLTDEILLAPRASLSVQIPGGASLRAAWGEYHQSPHVIYILPEWGNPDVHASKSTHYVLEVEKEVSNSTSIKLAGYYKDLEDLVTEHPTDIYLNQGKGFARGMELFLKYKPSKRFLGWLSYTYSLSRRKDGPDAPKRLYSFDQTHVATFIMSYKPTPKWEIGLRWNYASGMPFAPYARELSSRRDPPYHRLDLRFARKFQIRQCHIEFYLDILNAYDRRKSLSMTFSRDEEHSWVEYEEEEPVDFPMIPYIGFTMKF